MTTQTRIGALAALEIAISAATAVASIGFHRDPEKSVDATHDGVVIMRDGDPGSPEYILSPMSYSWEHQASFEITASGKEREAAVEAVIALFEPALAADRTLGGAVDDARIVLAPEIHEYPVDGAETERTAMLSVQLSYTTATGAG
ncbi:MAG TPA: hypothetical protein VGF56_05760 [Rhizomicrobium sp.]|jgi:hypothetical protein